MLVKIQYFFALINYLKNDRSYKKTIALSKKRKALLKNDRSIKKTIGIFYCKSVTFVVE